MRTCHDARRGFTVAPRTLPTTPESWLHTESRLCAGHSSSSACVGAPSRSCPHRAAGVRQPRVVRQTIGLKRPQHGALAHAPASLTGWLVLDGLYNPTFPMSISRSEFETWLCARRAAGCGSVADQ